MDEQALDQLLECSVCLERLDHTSKVLPCQHTFCRRCLEEIVSTKHELRCPECRTVVTIRVEDLPSNILLIRLLEGIKTQGQVLGHTSTTESYPPRNDSPSSLNSQARQQRQNLPCAKALYNYEAKESGDLSFRKNDVVLLRKQIDENWFHGELNGQHGFFPVNYVQVLVPLPQQPQCQALYDFDLKDEKEKDCLSFQKDEMLTVIRKVDDNWIEGKKGDKIGIFPVTFVKLNDAAKTLISSKTGTTILQPSNIVPPGVRNSESTAGDSHRVTSPSVSSVNPSLQASHPTSQQQKRHSFTLAPQKSPSPPTQHQRRSLELGNSGAFSVPVTVGGGTSTPPLPQLAAAPDVATATSSTTTSVATSSPKPAPALPQVPDVSPTASLPSTCSTTASSGADNSVLATGLSPVTYVANYSYKPQKEDELELRKGEAYLVSEKCQDGWFRGQCVKSGSAGVFPGNYVQLVRHQSAFKPVSPNVLNIRARAPIPAPSLTDSQGGGSPILDLTRTTSSTANQSHSPSSNQTAAPPPLLPRAPKIFSSSSTSSSSHSSRSNKAAITVPPPGFNSSSSKSSCSSQAASTTTAIHLPKRGHSSSPSSSGWSSSSLAAMHHSMSTSTNITPPNVVLGATGDTHHSHHSKEKNKKEKDKKERHDKESSKDRRDKEKKSLVKRLASKSKKSKSPGDNDNNEASADGSVTHVRSGSYPESGAGASDSSQHKKTGSFDSTVVSPPQAAKPSRPKPLAREKYRCIVPYPPQTEHELELQNGDIVYVHKKREDGWFKGTLARSGKTGLFPGSFVEKWE